MEPDSILDELVSLAEAGRKGESVEHLLAFALEERYELVRRPHLEKRRFPIDHLVRSARGLTPYLGLAI